MNLTHTPWVIVLGLVAGCSGAQGASGPDASGSPDASGPSVDGGVCETTYTTEVVVDDGAGGLAYRPVCGRSGCQPIATSGHLPPSYIAPASTCDELPPSVVAQCTATPTCACLEPLLRAFQVWPTNRWNCFWVCSSASDGGVDLLRCSLP